MVTITGKKLSNYAQHLQKCRPALYNVLSLNGNKVSQMKVVSQSVLDSYDNVHSVFPVTVLSVLFKEMVFDAFCNKIGNKNSVVDVILIGLLLGSSQCMQCLATSP